MCVGVKNSEEKDFLMPERTKTTEVESLTGQSEDFLNAEENVRKSKVEYNEDLLAAITRITKEAVFSLNEALENFKKTSSYKILCHTTQPAHVVTIVSVLCVAFLFTSDKTKATTISPLWTLVYLGSFSAHFGAQIWMTFVSGLALFFSLPRHTFGNVQQVLFPKYFFLNASLSLVTLAVFLRSKNDQLRTLEIGVQATSMALCFLIELLIYLYLTPPLLRLIARKTAIEIEAGVGMEVGKFNPGKLKNCSYYLKIHKAFRKVHMTIAMGNILTMACTSFHLYYLASKLCLLTL